MRACEFIAEAAPKGKLGKRRQNPTVGLDKFHDPQWADRFYELNRVMMAAATTDGTSDPNVNSESWVGRSNTASPYTKIEQDMMVKAFKAIGSSYQDLNNGNLNSEEVPSTYKVSPIKGFKGYPR